MPTNYVLIDFENVQPKNIELLKNHPFKVLAEREVVEPETELEKTAVARLQRRIAEQKG